MQEYKAALEQYSKGIQVFELDGVGAGIDEDHIKDLTITLYSNRSLVR